MDLPQLFRVFTTNFSIQLRARLQWRYSFFLDLLATGIWMSVYVLFWRVVFLNIPGFEGWTFSSMVVFVAFQELSYGFNAGFFSGGMKFWVYINTGRLDTALVRPMDVRLSAILLNLDPWQLLRSVLMFCLFTILAVTLGFPLNLFNLSFAILLAFLAAIAKTLLALSINYIAFWWGNVDFLHELIGTFDHFLTIPMNVLPSALQLVFTVGIPLIFAVTFPTLFAGGQLSVQDLWKPMAGLMISLIFWALLQEVTWRKGLKAYESYGG